MDLKDRIVEILERRSDEGEVVSGQELAAALNVSRTAIWKAVERLRQDGYDIEATTNRGYRLLGDSDVLNAGGIRAFLKAACANLEIEVLDEVDSTNNYTKNLRVKENSCGTLVVAAQQTAGRGRRGRNFFSPLSGAYMSILLDWKQRTEEAPFVTMAAAVSVCRAIEKLTTQRPKIKWVNDIFVNGKKVCGILSEAVTDMESGDVESVVVGIGVNIRIDEAEVPEVLRPVVGDIGGEHVTRNRLIAAIANEFFAWTDVLSSPLLIEEYKKRSLVLGREVCFEQRGEPMKGMAEDINERGNLMVRGAKGELIVLKAGEITLSSEQYVSET